MKRFIASNRNGVYKRGYRASLSFSLSSDAFRGESEEGITQSRAMSNAVNARVAKAELAAWKRSQASRISCQFVGKLWGVQVAICWFRGLLPKANKASMPAKQRVATSVKTKAVRRLRSRTSKTPVEIRPTTWASPPTMAKPP